MDYSRFECYDQGQKKDRMLSVAETIRSSLLDSPPAIDPLPCPVEGLHRQRAQRAARLHRRFYQHSTNANSHEWTVDGTPFSTTADASYTFNTEGSFQVTSPPFPT